MLEKATPQLKRNLAKNADAIRELKASPGWTYLVEQALRVEIESTITKLTSTSALPEGSLDYYRGALWALRRMQSLPDTTQYELEQTLSIVKAQLEAEQDG